ncbi:MAG: transmembrane glucosamine N-acetyltransferase NagX [Thalassotalea sp.]
MAATNIPTPVKDKNKTRILSIDALRGFDMIWILGLQGLFASWYLVTEWPFLNVLTAQMEHSQWHGLTAYDVIFPLFIFLSGVSIGIAGKRLSNYPLAKQKLMKSHAYKRLMLLIVLGVIYNHGWGVGIPSQLDDIRFASVLARIAIAGFITTLCVWYLSEKSQMLVTASILVGYWLLLEFVTIAGVGGGNYSATGALNVWFDQHFLPGASYQNLAIDPEGMLSNISSVVNALLGMFVGRHLIKRAATPYRLVIELSLAGAVVLFISYLWSFILPINKTLWTSSFTLATVGYSLLILAVFYYLIDVLKWQRVGKCFAVIGVNSILVYLASSLVNWHYLMSSFFGQIILALPSNYQALSTVLLLVLVQWFLLNWLYKRNIFIKV